jgi:hypothetical protein
MNTCSANGSHVLVISQVNLAIEICTVDSFGLDLALWLIAPNLAVVTLGSPSWKNEASILRWHRWISYTASFSLKNGSSDI